MGLGKLQSMDSGIPLLPAGPRSVTLSRATPSSDATAAHRIVDRVPQGRKDLYRVTLSDGTSTLAGAEHLWAVKSPTDVARGGDWRVLTTEQLGDARTRRAIADGARLWSNRSTSLSARRQRWSRTTWAYCSATGRSGAQLRPTSAITTTTWRSSSCQELTTDAIRKPPSSKYDWSVVGGATKRAQVPRSVGPLDHRSASRTTTCTEA